MGKLKNFFSYPSDIPATVRIASFLWLFLTVFSILAIPYIIIEDLGTKLLLYIIFAGISGFLTSYGLSHLKRWALYLFVVLITISSFIVGWISILFLIAFIFIIPDWKKFR